MISDTVAREMRQTIEEQAERIMQLEAALYGRGWEAPKEFGLSIQEERFLAALVAVPGLRCHDLLFDAVNSNSRDEPKRFVAVIACKVRTKLRPFGIRIEAAYGRGYALHEPDRQRLLNWPTTQSEAA